MLREVAPYRFAGAKDPSHASEVSAVEEVWGAPPALLRFLSLGSSELGTSASRAALSTVVGDGASSSDRVVPPCSLPLGEALVPACQEFAIRREVLPVVPLAASEAMKELVSTKGTPPAFALPVKVLSFWRGSVVLAEQSLARRSLAVRGG